MWLINATINFMAILLCGIATIHNICNGNEEVAIMTFVLLIINMVFLISNVVRIIR